MNKVEKTIAKIIADQLGIDQSSISLNQCLAHDLEADSLDVIEIVMEIEDEFSIQISEEEMDSTKTVKDIADLVKRHSS